MSGGEAGPKIFISSKVHARHIMEAPEQELWAILTGVWIKSTSEGPQGAKSLIFTKLHLSFIVVYIPQFLFSLFFPLKKAALGLLMLGGSLPRQNLGFLKKIILLYNLTPPPM